MRIRVRPWLTLMMIISSISALAGDSDIDFEKLARPEREQLASCMSDALVVIEKHRLAGAMFGLWELFDAACGMEIERVKFAARNQLKDPAVKEMLPGQLILGMVENATEQYKKRKLSDCSGTGCSLERYRTCLVRQIPAAVRDRKKPRDFETLSRQHCEDAEGEARSALANDFDYVQKHHDAGGINHKMNDAIIKLVDDVRHSVVVFYGEDLLKVQPERRSCKPEMCGASPCISLDVNQPTEYECTINQK